MNKMKLYVFVIIIILFGENLFGQKIYRDGYILKKSGEALNGMVEYSNNQDIPDVCKFKRFDVARIVQYFPKDIIAFGYRNGNRYESKEMDNKNSFYEVLVSGKITLYRKEGKFFIDKDLLGLVELKNNSITYSTSLSKTEYKTLSEFLNYITEGKAGVIPANLSMKNDLVPIIVSFNKVSGNPYNVFNRTFSEKQVELAAFQSGTNRNRFGIMSGVNLYFLSLKPLSGVFVPSPDLESANISGLTYERLISRITDRVSLRLDVLFYRQTFYCYNESVSSGFIRRNDVFFNFTGVKIPVMTQYSFTGATVVPFLNAGLAYQANKKQNYIRFEETENPDHVVNTLEYTNLLFKPFELSGLVGFGLRTRLYNRVNLSLQGRIEYGSGIFEPLLRGETYFRQKSIQSTFLIGITF